MLFGTIDIIESAAGFLRLLFSGILGVSTGFIIVAIMLLRSNSFGMGSVVTVYKEGSLKKLVIHKSCKDFRIEPGGADKIPRSSVSDIMHTLQADPGNTQIPVFPIPEVMLTNVFKRKK